MRIPQAIRPALNSSVWVTTAIGGTLGILSALLRGRRRSAYDAALSGLLGSTLGFGGGLAWTSRDLTATAARDVIRQLNAARDARWLARNPIDYA